MFGSHSLRFGTATTCTAADWSAAGTAGGDAIEDSTDDDTGDTVNFGYYDSVSATKKITKITIDSPPGDPACLVG